jgi:hypothetical protein
MPYDHQIQELLEVYFESRPLQWNIVLNAMLPALSPESAQEVFRIVKEKGLIQAVEGASDFYELTALGNQIMQNGGWISYSRSLDENPNL